MKTCTTCNTQKDLIFFNKRSDSKDGYRGQCKECRNKKARENKSKNIEKHRYQDRAKKHRRRAIVKNGKSYTQKQLQKLIKREGSYCFWCGKPIVFFHIDHIYPISSNIKNVNSIKNICISCKECNLSKSNKNPIDFVLEVFCGKHG